MNGKGVESVIERRVLGRRDRREGKWTRNKRGNEVKVKKREKEKYCSKEKTKKKKV